MKFGFVLDPLLHIWSVSLNIPFFFMEGFPNLYEHQKWLNKQTNDGPFDKMPNGHVYFDH